MIMNNAKDDVKQEATELTSYRQQVENVEKQVTGITITSENQGTVIDFVSLLKKSITEIDQKRKDAIRPLREKIVQTEEPYKILLQRIEYVKNMAEQQLSRFLIEQRKRAQEELQRQQAEARRRELQAIASGNVEEQTVTMPAVPSATIAKPSGSIASAVSRRTVEIEVVDIDKVPDQYIVKQVDLARVKTVVLSGIVKSIPGLKIEIIEGMSVRGKR
jgi:hypothetical protein